MGWILFAALLCVIVALVARRLGRRIATRRTESVREVRRSKRIAQLEREADDAAREGRWSDAVRLRFRAGILWLEDRGRVTTVERRPNGDVVREVERAAPLPALHPLAGMHDRVAYGDAPAGPEDHEAAVAAWSDVREKAGR